MKFTQLILETSLNTKNNNKAFEDVLKNLDSKKIIINSEVLEKLIDERNKLIKIFKTRLTEIGIKESKQSKYINIFVNKDFLGFIKTNYKKSLKELNWYLNKLKENYDSIWEDNIEKIPEDFLYDCEYYKTWGFNNLIKLIKTIEDKNIQFDITKIKSINELELELVKVNRISKKDIKSGIKNLTEGIDYIKIPNVSYNVFIPLSHKASKSIAHESCGGIQARWCTTQNSSDYWNKYMRVKNILVYGITELNSLGKFALLFIRRYDNYQSVQFFDYNDKSDTLKESNIPEFNKIKKYVEENFQSIREKIKI